MNYPKDYSQKPIEEFYQEAVDLAVEMKRATPSLFQRAFTIGYAKSAHLIDLMEERGVVGAFDGKRERKVLI